VALCSVSKRVFHAAMASASVSKWVTPAPHQQTTLPFHAFPQQPQEL
jgi:hypothetical protein